MIICIFFAVHNHLNLHSVKMKYPKICTFTNYYMVRNIDIGYYVLIECENELYYIFSLSIYIIQKACNLPYPDVEHMLFKILIGEDS